MCVLTRLNTILLQCTLLFLVGIMVVPLSAQPDKKRWKKVDEYIESALDSWDVPGVAVGIIDHGEIVLSKGYGLADVEAGTPVDEHSLFAIGSSSKAFTALAVATLVEDGEIEWDEPIKTYLPDFELWDETATEQMNAIDLLSHVSGLPRHDLAWYGSPRSREELYQSLKHFESTTSFRGGWQYQNLMFMTAGILVERVTGKTWEEYVQERILDPLGMEATNFSVSDLAGNDHAVKGYGLEEEEVKLLPYRNLDNIGPAGSINSNIVDMLKWADLMLSGGMVDTTEVIPAGAVRAVQYPRAIMPAGMNEDRFYMLYGMGWMITSYRGHLMVEHGGNIDGFSAGVCLLPEDSVGIVILSNMNGSPIPSVLEYYLTDLMLDLEEKDWNAEVKEEFDQMMSSMDEASEEDLMQVAGTNPSKEIAEFAGIYKHPGYGTLTIEEGDTSLMMFYNTLESPLEHYHYDVFRATDGQLATMKIQFLLDEDGAVEECAIKLQQGVERMYFEKQPNTDLSEETLDEYVGEYELMGMTIEITIEDETLRMTVPNQPKYTLAPIRTDVFDLTELDGFSVIFGRDEEGKINEMTSAQPNGNFTATRK